LNRTKLSRQDVHFCCPSTGQSSPVAATPTERGVAGFEGSLRRDEVTVLDVLVIVVVVVVVVLVTVLDVEELVVVVATVAVLVVVVVVVGSVVVVDASVVVAVGGL